MAAVVEILQNNTDLCWPLWSSLSELPLAAFSKLRRCWFCLLHYDQLFCVVRKSLILLCSLCSKLPTLFAASSKINSPGPNSPAENMLFKSGFARFALEHVPWLQRRVVNYALEDERMQSGDTQLPYSLGLYRKPPCSTGLLCAAQRLISGDLRQVPTFPPADVVQTPNRQQFQHIKNEEVWVLMSSRLILLNFQFQLFFLSELLNAARTHKMSLTETPKQAHFYNKYFPFWLIHNAFRLQGLHVKKKDFQLKK